MGRTLVADRTTTLRRWADALGRALPATVSGRVELTCDAGTDTWHHRCTVEGGVVRSWTEVAEPPVSIHHRPEVLDDLLAGHASPFDVRWRLRSPGETTTLLPPRDLGGRFLLEAMAAVPADLSIEWCSTATTVGGHAVTWTTQVAAQRATNRLHPEVPSAALVDPSVVGVGSPAPSMATFSFPVDAYLAVRGGADPLVLFDGGGSLDGGLDELLFIAGVLDLPAWRREWGLPPAQVALLRSFFAVLGAAPGA